MNGTVIEAPRDQVLAQWTYSELLTRHEYEDLDNVQGLRARKAQGTTFNELVPNDQAFLVQAWEKVRGGNSVFAVTLQNVQTFRLIEWTRDRLGEVSVIPYFVSDISLNLDNRVIFKSWIRADPIKPLHQTHARYAFYGASPSGADDPGVVGQLGGLSVCLTAIIALYGSGMDDEMRTLRFECGNRYPEVWPANVQPL
jgi:hypothetical protein